MQKCITIILLSFLTGSVWSQSLKEFLEQGDRLFAKQEYHQAMDEYMKAFALDAENAHTNFRVGLTWLYLPQKTKALSYLLKAYHSHHHVDDDINYHVGLAYQHNHQYKLAKEHFELFRKKNKRLADIADHKIFECEMADSLTQRPVRVLIENLGPAVNSPYHDYSPVVSSARTHLIFTSNRLEEGDKSNRNDRNNYEDIYIANDINGYWDTPRKISPNINIKFHDAAASVSPDGKTLFLYYEQGSGDIFTSSFDGAGWSKPVPLNKNINTPFWETSASMSADGRRLYFTSSKPGGLGELDIYVSERDANGDWGKARNLGPTINTPGNEDSPFIHEDGVTLYFSSNGHPTMGNNDIFYSEFKDGQWQRPVNLGFPINSPEYDGFFCMSPDKKSGYYSTFREDGYGDTDIYSVTFLDAPGREDMNILASNVTIIPEPESSPEGDPATRDEEPHEEKPQPSSVVDDDYYVDPIVQLHKELDIVTILRGKVIDEKSAAPLGATITLVDNTSNRIMMRIASNPETGDFELTIPHGGNYGVATEREGYLFNSINFNLPQFAEMQEVDTHIIMVKAEVGSKVILKNIFFDSGKSDLKPESISELSHLLKMLEHNPNVRVQINGHTDNIGDKLSNKALSLKRASSVVNYLAEKGIARERLSAVGYGEEKPLVSNDDEEEGRKFNRRTEIEIIK